ncbi:4-(cytidine 5'-diphospho)-2-C-methyl-D-erythritol kinase [Arsenicitalea aurantiaca]|uniref:4-diphosphocytidyl-2-C-methyl-D-erythritol kinase n=1 Tax=Arsenicitalea aurantiaca TaxID=1783274 RepID=A0A433XAP8_9HYPH|nr:4-(cytidine 5'-diphospho)-2-C-methyl-D-erythritol kinase [Arsenicitalea aurantiaca]RUT31145.1 4-(cytidine 5'-diphospho)-2-C-methyl-D-erythritol kinase [Arsenicitalea aurantiaca]
MSVLATEAAPAKINLALHITRRREDFYHELESLVVFAGIGDEISVSPSKADSLLVVGPFTAGLGNGPSNLVLRAARAFRAHWPDRLPDGLAFTLSKNLPVAAGIGGGSADAAAVLRLLARLAGEIDYADLSALAATLGADIPACLLSRPCEMRGIGEIIHPLRDFPQMHVVLVNPLVPVATADVFRRLERHDNPGLPPLPEPMTLPAQLGLWLEGTRNDLEAPAFNLVPALAQLVDALQQAQGSLLGRMSGSGGTVFGLFGSESQAHQAAHDLRERWPGHWVAAAPLIGA